MTSLLLLSESYKCTFLTLRELLITDTELKLIAAAAIMGDNNSPKTRWQSLWNIGLVFSPIKTSPLFPTPPLSQDGA